MVTVMGTRDDGLGHSKSRMTQNHPVTYEETRHLVWVVWIRLGEIGRSVGFVKLGV